MDHLTAICLAAFLGASSADTITTAKALHAGAAEGNPALQGWHLPAVKATSAALTTAWALKATKEHPKTVRTVLIIGGAFYTGIALHNYGVYQTQKGRP